MLDDTAVTTESAPVTPAAETSQATTQPEQQTGGPQSQTVPYERFQQVNRQMREFERQNAQLNHRLQQLEQARQQTGQPQSDEERALKEARDAFYGKVAPELKDVPQMLQGFAQQQFVSQGGQMLQGFAQQHGLDAKALEDNLADIIKNDPALLARAQRGDVRLVAQYLKGLEPVITSLKQQGQQNQRQQDASLAANKRTLTTQVPPRQAGGQSGAAAPKPLSGDFRKDIADLNNEADTMLRGLLAKG